MTVDKQHQMDMAAAQVAFAQSHVAAVFSNPGSTPEARALAPRNLQRAQQELANAHEVASIPARVVLDGDPEVIEAALDALPDRAVVTCEAVNEPGVFMKGAGIDGQCWHGVGRTTVYMRRYLARYCAPLVVIR